MKTAALQLPLSKGHLELEFAFREDRWGHSVSWYHDGQRFVLLTSCEGNPSEAWPPSPPLQYLEAQQIHDQPTLLGVGMAGRSHWSLSAHREDQSIHLDWACRVHPPGGSLGTTYQTFHSEWHTDGSRPPGLDWLLPGSPNEIQLRLSNSTEIQPAAGGQATFSLRPKQKDKKVVDSNVPVQWSLVLTAVNKNR